MIFDGLRGGLGFTSVIRTLTPFILKTHPSRQMIRLLASCVRAKPGADELADAQIKVQDPHKQTVRLDA